MNTASMPLHMLTKHRLKQSDGSLPLTSISSCRDQPPSTDEHALPVKQISSLSNGNCNSNLPIDGLTKSPFLHSSSSSVYSSSAEPTNNRKREYTTTFTSIALQSQESAKSIDSSVGVTSVSEGSHYSQKSAQKQKWGFKQALSFSSLRKRENDEKNPFK